jgi:hypothetical protein
MVSSYIIDMSQYAHYSVLYIMLISALGKVIIATICLKKYIL